MTTIQQQIINENSLKAAANDPSFKKRMEDRIKPIKTAATLADLIKDIKEPAIQTLLINSDFTPADSVNKQKIADLAAIINDTNSELDSTVIAEIPKEIGTFSDNTLQSLHRKLSLIKLLQENLAKTPTLHNHLVRQNDANLNQSTIEKISDEIKKPNPKLSEINTKLNQFKIKPLTVKQFDLIKKELLAKNAIQLSDFKVPDSLAALNTAIKATKNISRFSNTKLHSVEGDEALLTNIDPLVISLTELNALITKKNYDLLKNQDIKKHPEYKDTCKLLDTLEKRLTKTYDVLLLELHKIKAGLDKGKNPEKFIAKNNEIQSKLWPILNMSTDLLFVPDEKTTIAFKDIINKIEKALPKISNVDDAAADFQGDNNIAKSDLSIKASHSIPAGPIANSYLDIWRAKAAELTTDIKAIIKDNAELISQGFKSIEVTKKAEDLVHIANDKSGYDFNITTGDLHYSGPDGQNDEFIAKEMADKFIKQNLSQAHIDMPADGKYQNLKKLVIKELQRQNPKLEIFVDGKPLNKKAASPSVFSDILKKGPNKDPSKSFFNRGNKETEQPDAGKSVNQSAFRNLINNLTGR
jgi:hypothetical protein